MSKRLRDKRTALDASGVASNRVPRGFPQAAQAAQAAQGRTRPRGRLAQNEVVAVDEFGFLDIAEDGLDLT